MKMRAEHANTRGEKKEKDKSTSAFHSYETVCRFPIAPGKYLKNLEENERRISSSGNIMDFY